MYFIPWELLLFSHEGTFWKINLHYPWFTWSRTYLGLGTSSHWHSNNFKAMLYYSSFKSPAVSWCCVSMLNLTAIQNSPSCHPPIYFSSSPCKWRQVIDTYSLFTDYFLVAASKLSLPIVDYVTDPNSTPYLSSTPFVIGLYNSSH